MLKPEHAQERLATFKLQDGKKRQQERMKALADPLRRMGYALLRRDAKGEEIKSHEEKQKIWDEAFRALTESKPEERTAIFTALYPALGEVVERAWQLFDHLPYQAGWERKSFRTRGTHNPVNAQRSSWLYSLQDDL